MNTKGSRQHSPTPPKQKWQNIYLALCVLLGMLASCDTINMVNNTPWAKDHTTNYTGGSDKLVTSSISVWTTWLVYLN